MLIVYSIFFSNIGAKKYIFYKVFWTQSKYFSKPQPQLPVGNKLVVLTILIEYTFQCV